MHCGHSEFLRKCKAQCDVLVVMAPTDRQIAFLKPGRPITKEQDRLLLIDAIRWVDYCFLDPWARNDLTGIEEVLKLLHPHRYFCGPDSHDMEYREAICKQHGVELVIVPRYEGITTTSIMEKQNGESRLAQESASRIV